MKIKVMLAVSLLAPALMFPNTGKDQVLYKSDLQHLTLPGAFYLGLENLLEITPATETQSENMAIGVTLLLCFGKEYYDYRNGGCSSQKDLELDLLSIVSSYYINRGFKSLLNVIGGKNAANN